MAKTTAERIADLEQWAAQHDGRNNAYWTSQHAWNEEMQLTAQETANSLREHLVRCEETHKAAKQRAERVESKLCAIAESAKQQEKDRAFSRGAYAVLAALVVLVPIAIQLAALLLKA